MSRDPNPIHPNALQQSWIRRNRIIAYPLGCLAALALCVGGVALVLHLLLSDLKSSEPYRHAVQQATQDLTVQQTLGTPIKAAFYATGRVRSDNTSGQASLAIPISGPNGDALIFVEAAQQSGEWSYSQLMVEIDESRERINLRSR